MDNSGGEEEKPFSRRPDDTKFKQQKLPAWQPVMTASSVLPFMFAVGVAFIPLGIAFLITSNSVKEVLVDYTQCQSINGSETCAQSLSNHTGGYCLCNVTFTLPTDFSAPVYVYYSLTNFYQNHRRYVKSRDDNQLAGYYASYESTDCKGGPYVGAENVTGNGKNYIYAPCGAIANSMFNDTLQIFFADTQLTLNDTDIAWSTDRNRKFKNPPGNDFNTTLKPPNWPKPVNQLDPDHPENNGYQNEDLMVWMRTAALPTFRKLYRRVTALGNNTSGLPAGNYSLIVNYTFPTVQFNGAKRMIITTTSWLGGKNPFLGIAYLVVGSLCIIIGFVFLIIHIKVGKSSSDMQCIPLTSRSAYYDESLTVRPNSS